MKKQLDIKKLVLLNLPYLLMGAVRYQFWEKAGVWPTGADASAKMLSFFSTLPGGAGQLVAQPFHAAGPAGGPVLRCWPATGRLPQKQERQKVPAWHGVRLCPLECIILSVKEAYMDAQEGYAHELIIVKLQPFTPAFPWATRTGTAVKSNSIQNQKIFLENYARGQHLTNIRHYIDDDESGRFFDRSAYSPHDGRCRERENRVSAL